MPEQGEVRGHYTHGRLLDAIRDGLERLGKSPADATVDDLAPVDEFHIGGRVATERFLDALAIDSTHTVLDVGCGLGGASRFAADRYGCRVQGIDLTGEYVETGNALCGWVGLSERVRLAVGDATALDTAADAFDRAFVLHVGMNIADKAALCRELFRVLRPGGQLGIYDVMQLSRGDLVYPVPWATTATGSAVASPDDYCAALAAAGFEVRSTTNRRDFALEFFAALKAKSAQAGGPPPLGLHILMGDTAPRKIENMIDNISRGLLGPVEILATKPA